MWDTEVDIACIGAGSGGLANAIATVDAGGEVFVADASPTRFDGVASGTVLERVHAKRGWLIQQTLDADTEEYLAALAEGVAERTDLVRDESVPVRAARNLSPEEAYARTVEPFRGSRLTDWAAQCLSSPYGLVHTSMRERRTTTMRSSEGDLIEVFPVGAMDWCDGDGESALDQWIADQARQRDIEVRAASTLQQIVFEEGVIVGVVLSTPEGPYAVRTRAGVTFAPSERESAVGVAANLSPGDRLTVGLVCRTASRFARLELLATEPAAPARPTCTASGIPFREGLHESRHPSLEGWRCGKVHGYPSFG